MLEELRQLDPWFATVSQASEWFRLRRSAVFEEIRIDNRVVAVKVRTADGPPSTLPGLRLRYTRGDDVNFDVAEPTRGEPALVEKEFRITGEISLVS